MMKWRYTGMVIQDRKTNIFYKCFETFTKNNLGKLVQVNMQKPLTKKQTETFLCKLNCGKYGEVDDYKCIVIYKENKK